MNEQQGIRMDNAGATWPSEPRFSGDQRRPLLLTSQLPLGSSLGGTLIPEPDGVADDFDDELQQLLAGLDEIGTDGVKLRRLERTRSPPIVLKRAHKPVARHLHRGQHQRQRQEEAEEHNQSDDDGGELSPTTLQIQRMLAELNGSGSPPTPPRGGRPPTPTTGLKQQQAEAEARASPPRLYSTTSRFGRDVASDRSFLTHVLPPPHAAGGTRLAQDAARAADGHEEATEGLAAEHEQQRAVAEACEGEQKSCDNPGTK